MDFIQNVSHNLRDVCELSWGVQMNESVCFLGRNQSKSIRQSKSRSAPRLPFASQIGLTIEENAAEGGFFLKIKVSRFGKVSRDPPVVCRLRAKSDCQSTYMATPALTGWKSQDIHNAARDIKKYQLVRFF